MEPRVYHRLESPTQTAIDAREQAASMEIWGYPPFGSDIPKVKAYEGPLPDGKRGIEFLTSIPPDSGAPRGQAYWFREKPGVRLEADRAILRVGELRNRQP
jgi:hypothetical protein